MYRRTFYHDVVRSVLTKVHFCTERKIVAIYNYVYNYVAILTCKKKWYIETKKNLPNFK